MFPAVSVCEQHARGAKSAVLCVVAREAGIGCRVANGLRPGMAQCDEPRKSQKDEESDECWREGKRGQSGRLIRDECANVDIIDVER